MSGVCLNKKSKKHIPWCSVSGRKPSYCYCSLTNPLWKAQFDSSPIRSSPGCDLWVTHSTQAVFTSPQISRGAGKGCQHHLQENRAWILIFWLRFGTMGKEKIIYTRRKKLPRQDLKITFKWDKEMIAIAGKGQTHSHLIRVAALPSAASGFPVRSNWIREWLNPVQEVAGGFINLILWIIMPPSFTNEPAFSKWCRSAFLMWSNLILPLYVLLCCH